MAIDVYQLTNPVGERWSHSIGGESTNWMVIHALRFLGYSTPDDIAQHTGLQDGEVRMTLRELTRKGIVEKKI